MAETKEATEIWEARLAVEAEEAVKAAEPAGEAPVHRPSKAAQAGPHMAAQCGAPAKPIRKAVKANAQSICR